MLPNSIEEKSFFADCSYGKNPDKPGDEKSIETIEKKARTFGGENPIRLAKFRKLFRL